LTSRFPTRQDAALSASAPTISDLWSLVLSTLNQETPDARSRRPPLEKPPSKTQPNIPSCTVFGIMLRKGVSKMSYAGEEVQRSLHCRKTSEAVPLSFIVDMKAARSLQKVVLPARFQRATFRLGVSPRAFT